MTATLTAADLREKRGHLVHEMEAVKTARDERLEKDETADRSFTAEELQTFERLESDFDELESQIVTAEQEERIASFREKAFEAPKEPTVKLQRDEDVEDEDRSISHNFMDWALGRNAAKTYEVTPNQHRHVQDRYRQFRQEDRALSVGTDASGGYAVDSEPMASIVQAFQEYAPLLSRVDVITTDKGGDLPIPTINDTSNQGQVRAEAAARVTNQDPTFGQVTLGAYNVESGIVQVSNELLQDFNQDAPSIIGGLLGERVSDNMGDLMITGTGSSTLQGLTNATTNFDTGANALAASDLYAIEDLLNLRYRESDGVFWVLSKSAITSIRSITASNEQVFQPNLREGSPSTIIGYPYILSPDLGSVTTNGNTWGILMVGNAYKVRMVRGGRFQRFDELYAANGQVGMLYSVRADAKIVDPKNDMIVRGQA